MANKKYKKTAHPFEIWNIENQETVYLQDRTDEYISFMLKFYQALPLAGFRYLHGIKEDRAIYVGPLDNYISIKELEKVVIECRNGNFNKIDVLGWKWDCGVNKAVKELADKNGVEPRLIKIPSLNELESALVGYDIALLKVPGWFVEKELAKHVKFKEVSYLGLEIKLVGKEVTIKITDYKPAQTVKPDDISIKVKDKRKFIDYWAIDWDFEGRTFHNQWHSFRAKKSPEVDYEARHLYEVAGEYVIMVKVVDLFGNDTDRGFEVRMGSKNAILS